MNKEQDTRNRTPLLLSRGLIKKSKRAQHAKTSFLSCSSNKSQHAKRSLFLGCVSKRAQLQQIFIYVSAIIVIGFIILFGYKMIGKVLGQKCSVEEQDFMLGITNYLDQNIRYLSRDQAVLPMACGYNILCFVNASVVGDTSWYDSSSIESNFDISTDVIEVNAQDNISYNVYLYKEGKDITYPVAYDKRINVANNEGILCIEAVAGSFRYMIEGQGKNGVIISES